MSRNFCGLDFGTSNSTLAFMRQSEAVLAPLEGEAVTLPSAVFYDFEDHSVRFGRDAITTYIDGAEGRLLRALKSVLGSALIEETTLIQRKRVAVRAIIGMFVRHVKAVAERSTGALDAVVLGRPVRFVDDDDAADRKAESEIVARVEFEVPKSRPQYMAMSWGGTRGRPS